MCDVSKLKKGDILYEVTYYVVDSVEGDAVEVEALPGGPMRISHGIVEECHHATDQWTSERKVTRTELAQKIETLGHAAFRITFQKQVSNNDVADGLADKDLTTQAKRRKLVNGLMQGETRVMHAKLLRSEEFDASMELGRYKVIDLQELHKTGAVGRSIRMVDTRTISELVVDNTRYYV